MRSSGLATCTIDRTGLRMFECEMAGCCDIATTYAKLTDGTVCELCQECLDYLQDVSEVISFVSM